MPEGRIQSIHKADRSESTAQGSSVDARTVALIVIAAGVTIFLLQHMQSLFAPIAFGLLMFCALDPIVDAMERVHIPRWIGAAVTLLLTMGTIGAGAYALQDEALTVVNELPAGARKIVAAVQRRPASEPSPLEKVEQAAKELQKTDTAKPAPGVMRVQVEEPRLRASDLLWSGSLARYRRSITSSSFCS